MHHYENVVDGHAVMLPDGKRVYAEDELTALTAQAGKHGCHLPSAIEIRMLSAKAALWKKIGLQQFYWIADTDSKVRGYALYFHVPSGEVMEFGDYVFPAGIVFICS